MIWSQRHINFIMKQTQLWNLLAFAVIILSEVQSQPQGLTSYETSACHGGSETFNATCNSGYVIAVGDITMGAKLTSSGCELFYNSSFDYDTCCVYDDNDCTFPFNDNTQYHDQCNGEPSCHLGTQHQGILDNCDALNGTFGADGVSGYFSHYMILNYYCVEDDKMVEMCSGQNSPLTRENTEVYIWNRDFPASEIQPSDSSCNCSIEIDNCDAGINIYTMYRKLTGDGDGVCNQTLRVLGGEDGTFHYEWSCSDNMFDFETNNVQETYIQLSLENDRNVTGGKFWFGFRASLESNITVSCPPVMQQYCISNATTTTATTKTTTTTTAATTTTTNATTTTTSTTNSTNTELNSTTSSLTTTTTIAPSRSSTRPSLEDEVIALGIVGALLLITVIVLACCLHRTCRRMKAERDIEKVASGSTQQPQEVILATHLTSNISDRKSVPPSATEFNVPSKLADASYQASLAHLKAETNEFGCQVETVEQETGEMAHTLSTVQTEEKGTVTVPTSLSDSPCQTDVVHKKNYKVQVNINLSVPVATAFSQTDAIIKNATLSKSQTFLNEIVPDEHLNEKISSQKIVGNGAIISHSVQDDKLQKDETVSLKKETVARNTEKKTRETSITKNKPESCQHKKHKKERMYKSERKSSVRDSPADLESIMPELKRETPVQYNQEEVLVEEAFDEYTDSEVNQESTGDIQTIQVAPCGVMSELPKDISHVERMRKTIAYSFFSKERFETKLLKVMYKQSKGHKHKKTTKTPGSEC